MKMKNLMSSVLLILALGVAGAAVAGGDNGLITKKSKYSAAETLDRLADILEKKGINVFARVSHKKNAAGVNLELRPTELLIFGNPKLGTHFFTSNQTAGIDLPMKALAWEDEKGQVWLTYNDPAYIARRHGIGDRDEVAGKMSNALKKLTDKASGN